MKIILIGIQGSGKSTQGNLLAKKYAILYLSSGDIFRQIARVDSQWGRYVRETLNAGVLIPDDKVIPVVTEYLEKPEFQKGYILDGFPRTLTQAESFQHRIDHVIYLALSDETARRRIAKQAKQRGDHTKTAIDTRITLFYKQTKPVIEYYRAQNKLITVDAAPPVEDIFNKIVAHIEKPSG